MRLIISNVLIERDFVFLSETVHGFSILRYWPHFLSEDGNMVWEGGALIILLWDE